MLAMADRNGEVQCTIPGLADRAKITLEQCEIGLSRFQQPDKYSWSRESEGRRIREIAGGWELLNHRKYRDMLSLEDRRDRDAVRQRNWRAKNKSVTPRDDCDASLKSRHTDTDVDLDTDTKALKSNTVALRAPRKQLTILPENFSPNETNIKNAERLGLDLQACTEAFKDFHLSKGNRFADWNMALNTWLRNQVGFSRPARGVGIPADFVPRDFEAEREAKRLSDFKEKMRLRDAQG